ncbi:MAG: UMP kinase [Planctomycetota bacterium]
MKKPARPLIDFRRIVLKVSGESLAANGEKGVSADEVLRLAEQVKSVHERGTQVAVVVGGGNLVRGTQFASSPQSRVAADHMGMLATAINGLALQDALEQKAVPSRVLSAFSIGTLCEPFAARRCVSHLEKGRVAILVGGTGSPFFTTDTTAALRASEIGAGVFLKATKVDGVYSGDPLNDRTARRFEHVSYMDVIQKRLKVMDLTAITLCMEQRLPIIVFDLWQAKSLARVVAGEALGTLVSDA